MPSEPELAAENARLRERVAQLETEVAALREDTAAVVARAQESLYWFDRWGVDFNRLFARREMEALRRIVRGARSVVRSARKLRDRSSA